MCTVSFSFFLQISVARIIFFYQSGSTYTECGKRKITKIFQQNSFSTYDGTSDVRGNEKKKVLVLWKILEKFRYLQ